MMDKNKTKGMVFIGIGFELGALVIGALYVGNIIDESYDWPGYAAVTLLVAAFISWLFHLIILLKKFSDDEELDS